MKKNIIIAGLALLNIVSLILWLRPVPTKEHSIVFGFPELRLAENERITSVEIQFQTAVIKAVRNIPPGWAFSMVLDPPPNPKVVGSITVGVAAVGSSKELPVFELERYVKEAVPAAVRATFEIEEYSPNPKGPKKLTIELGKDQP